MIFSEIILDWYQQNKRQLPWRTTTDPYRIWLSEVLLQQTRVAQGLPYYNTFIENFPTVYDMASASEEQILKLWQGLGYYSRARNMHYTAKQIVERYNGEFPNSFKELKKLKGVGEYTASAIASICFNQSVAVVDGNVYRVLARYFGVDLPINSNKGIHYFKELANEVIHKTNIRDYNQAIMEFGAIQCSPKKPACLLCPLSDSCKALQENRVFELPVKLKKGKIRHRYFNYLVCINAYKQTRLHKRITKGIWQNLYEFPLLETEYDIDELSIKGVSEALNLPVTTVELYNTNPIIHKLSHQHLHTKFWIVTVNGEMDKAIPVKNLENYPVPVLVADFIKAFKF